MPRIDLNELTNLQNESTAVGTINVNNADLEAIFDNVVFRDGTSPNHMLAELDMNSNKIINLPAAIAGSADPVRAVDLANLVPSFTAGTIAVNAAIAAEVAAQNAAAQAIAAAASVTVGTLGIQNANSVNISGGTIAGTTITGLPDPLVPSDLSNKRYSDKQNPDNARVLVRLATTTTLPNSPTYTAATSSVLDILEATTNGVLSVDGVTVADGDRILVKNQATAAHNNVYVSSTVGSHWKLTRVPDLDEGLKGETFYVNEGSTNGGKYFARVNSATPNYYTDTVLAIQTNDFPTKGQFEDITRTVASHTSSILNISGNTFTYASLSFAQSASIPKTTKTVILTGYYNNGDCPKAYYKRVNSQPSHPGRFRSADRFLVNEVVDNTNGGWWELIETKVDLRMLGAVCDGNHATEDTLAWSNASSMHTANKLFHLIIPPNCTVTINQGVFTRGSGTKDLVIEGYGASSVVKAANKAALNSILESDPGAGALTLMNFVLDGNRHNTGMAHPVSTGGIVCFSDNIKFIGMEFKEFAFAGVVLFSLGGPLLNGVLVKDCYFHDIGYTTDETGGGNPYANLGTAMFGGADNVTLMNNRFIDIHGLIEPIGDSNAFNVLGDNHIAIGNYCRNCHNGRGGMFGMGAANSKRVIVIGNVVEQTVYFASERSNGISIETDAGGYWTVSNNVITGMHGSGISTATTSRAFSLTNNVIKDWGCNGETNAYALYAIQDVTFGKISGNVFSQVAGSGVYGIIVNTTGGNILVNDNAFDGSVSIVNTMNYTPSAIVIPNNLNFNNTMHVADLPGAAANPGLRLSVNDSSVTTFNSIVAGGGGSIVGVVAGNGVWRVG